MTEEDGRTPSKEDSKNHDLDIHTARVGTQLYMSPEQVYILHSQGSESFLKQRAIFTKSYKKIKLSIWRKF